MRNTVPGHGTRGATCFDPLYRRLLLTGALLVPALQAWLLVGSVVGRAANEAPTRSELVGDAVTASLPGGRLWHADG